MSLIKIHDPLQKSILKRCFGSIINNKCRKIWKITSLIFLKFYFLVFQNQICWNRNFFHILFLVIKIIFWYSTSWNGNSGKINYLFKLHALMTWHIYPILSFFCSPEYNWMKIFGYIFLNILCQIEIDFFLRIYRKA